MSLDQLTNLLIVILLIEMMIAVGLSVSLHDVAGVFTNWSLIFRAAFANYALVPAFTVALLFLFHPPPLISAGFLLVAVCPAAPFGPPLTAIAKADIHVSVGLMVLLAASSAIVAPFLLAVLVPLIVQNADLRVDSLRILRTLIATQLLPLGIGLAIRWKAPGLADRLQGPAKALMGILSLLVFGLVIAVQFRTLTQYRAVAYLGITLLVALCLAAGLLLGGRSRSTRWAVALATATRNVGVALVIATASFPNTPVASAVVVFAVLQTILLATVAVLVGRAGRSVQIQPQP